MTSGGAEKTIDETQEQLRDKPQFKVINVCSPSFSMFTFQQMNQHSHSFPRLEDVYLA